jgi:hypothetical protein
MRSFGRARRFRTARCLGNLSARAKREQYRRGKKQPPPKLGCADAYWTEKLSANLRNFIFCKHDRFLLLLM